MNIIDIILLLIVIPMIIRGISTGFISQAFGLAAMVAGTLVAWRLTLTAGPAVSEHFGIGIKMANVLSFAVIFIIVSMILVLLGKVLRKIVRLVLLGWLDSLLGALFALMTAILVCGLILLMFDSLNETLQIVDKEYLDGSLFYHWLIDFVKAFFPYVSELLHKAKI